jgi:predicted GIY-YIG superfamily endonuclease
MKKGVCGIYILSDCGIVVYVGASKNVRGRLYKHRGEGVEFTEVLVEECLEEEFPDKEAAAIKKYRPRLNEQNATIWVE